MTPAHISAAIAVLTVLGVIAKWVLPDCTSLRDCEAVVTAPTPTVLQQAREADERYRRALDTVCARAALAPMFRRSPCLSAQLGHEHLKDEAPLDDAVSAVQAHSAAITAATAQFVADMGVLGDTRQSRVAAAYEGWDRQRAADLQQLLQRRATWAQLNRERQRQRLALQRSVSAVIDL